MQGLPRGLEDEQEDQYSHRGPRARPVVQRGVEEVAGRLDVLQQRTEFLQGSTDQEGAAQGAEGSEKGEGRGREGGEGKEGPGGEGEGREGGQGGRGEEKE